MSIPTGQIVARPMVARACGCLQEFQHFAVDKYRAQRLAKFQKTRCSKCVEKLNAEQQKAAAALPKKGELMQMLPAGTQVSLTRRADGTWSGTLTADGAEFKADGEGTQGLVLALCRLWVSKQTPREAVSEKTEAEPVKPARPQPKRAAEGARPAKPT